jgi:hypothetical protein
MHDVERTSAYTLRRRRLVGLVLLAAFVPTALALNDWLFTPIWSVFDNGAERSLLVGDPFDEWIYVVCDGEQQQITVSQDGRLAGATALGTLRRARFQDTCDLPLADNPNLADWQSQLTHLQTLTHTPGSAGAEILDAARKMPVSVLYLRPLSEWIRDDDANAVEFLDAVAREPMRFDDRNPAVVRARRDNFSKLIDAALDEVVAGDIVPGGLSWLESRQIVGSGYALPKLAGMRGVGNDALASILERLDTVPAGERGDLYGAVASRLVHDGEYAALLSKQLGLVPRETRFVAVRQLLARSDASVQFPIALLANFRRQFHSADDQLELFMATADKLRHEAEAPLLLTMHLRDLEDMQRRMAATYLLSLDGANETAFTLGVLRSFADLHPLSRPKVVYAVMQSPQFQDRAVQEACLLAIRLQTQGPEQEELLSAMLRHRDLESDLRPAVGADLG